MGRLALAFASGLALIDLGGSSPAPALAALLAALIWTSRRPASRPWLLAGVAGIAAGMAARTAADACPPPAAGARAEVHGRFLAPAHGGAAPFELESGCGGRISVVARSAPVVGRRVRLVGVWREGRAGPWLLAGEVEAAPGADDAGLRWRAVRWRADLLARLERLYGPRGPLVAALVLARREGLDPDVREAFARSGTAHLLAISGFHVGVIAVIALALMRAVGLSRRRAGLAAAVVVWGYVAVIGFPDAAARAALIVTLMAVARLRGRPTARFGALALAFLSLLLADPRRLSGVGFQLSFAGAAGLVAWAPAVRLRLRRAWGGRCPDGLASAVGAGVAATAATLPVVAWHFERVSIVGIPATLLASPVVALALPGALASLALDVVFPPAAAFLAGGVDVLLATLEGGARALASIQWASLWIPRSWVVVGSLGGWLAWRVAAGGRVRGEIRRGVMVAGVVASVGAWPLARVAAEWGTVELVMVDVGQGDGLLLRSPHGRWVVVDAGPPPNGPPGSGPVMSALRGRGVSRVEALVLTHPHLDHFGEAGALLSSVEVGTVMDPAVPTGETAWVSLLARAASRGVPWRRARAGDRWELDGMTFEVLHPREGDTGDVEDLNDVSVVLHVSYGAFDLLLTGDAPASVERRVAAGLDGRVEVLKVAHHGSDTSSDSLFVWSGRPQVALVSVGQGNRYGHPSPAVMDRLVRAGVEVHRTDVEGRVRVVGRRDGRFQVTVEHGRRP